MEEKKKIPVFSSSSPCLFARVCCCHTIRFFCPLSAAEQGSFHQFCIAHEGSIVSIFWKWGGGEVGLGGDTAEVARVPYTESCGTLTPFPAQWPKLLTASACRKKRFIMTVRVLYIKKFGSLKRLFASSDTYILTS